MNLLLLGLIHPYKAFLNAKHENFILVLISFILGMGFLFFGVQEFFSYINFEFPSQIIAHINQFPYAHMVEVKGMIIFSLFLKSLTILTLFSIAFSLINYIWGTVFSTGHNMGLLGHIKSSFIFFYSFSFYLILIDILLFFLEAQYFYLYILGFEFIILMTLMYSAIYYTSFVKAFFNILINFFSILLIGAALYTLSLFLTEDSVEQGLKDNFDKTIESIKE